MAAKQGNPSLNGRKVLVTGACGWLGSNLITKLVSRGASVVAVDIKDPQPRQDYKYFQADIADRNALAKIWQVEGPFHTVFHCAALHKPMIITHSRQQFIDTNITGTLSLLEESLVQLREGHPTSFVFTSTTSLMINEEIKRSKQTYWIDESLDCRPRNIYGVTKLSAEHICRMFNESYSVPIVILRTSRFFPEADDLDDSEGVEVISDENLKANEYLNRRLSIEDCVLAHELAMEKAKDIKFGCFMVSAPTPFNRDDVHQLSVDPMTVVEKYFPRVREIYAKYNWQMGKPDRVYDSSLAQRVLGWNANVTFATVLEGLERGVTSFP